MMRNLLGRFSAVIATFRKARQGTTAIMFAIAMPALVGAGGFATDYTVVNSSRNQLQGIIDSAALAIAREMTVTVDVPQRAQALAQQYVAANIPANTPYAISVTATMVENNMAVKITGQQQIATPFGLLERFAGVNTISATALARVTASTETQKLCLLSLGEKIDGGIYLHNGSEIMAPNCIFHSNSTQTKAVIISQGSKIKAGLMCARGGYVNQGSIVEAAVVSDCPVQNDPLSSKPEPALPLLCQTGGNKFKTGSITLNPGKYCGGLELSGTVKARLNPGIYFIDDGDLAVSQDAELVGAGVTFMFTGKKSYFRFKDNALIQISAPTSGVTAGMLMWESGNLVSNLPANANSAAKAATGKTKKLDEHHINSNRAKELTGTIYLKRGLLMIDSNMPIADQSPYTILVVEKLDLFDGPRFVLNSNYSGSIVPVPAGLGPIGASTVRLGQ